MEINEQYKRVDIDLLISNVNNPKVDFKKDPSAKKEYDKLIKSLKVNGQVEPILVRIDPENNKYYIVNGNHRWFGMKDLKELGDNRFNQVDINILGTMTEYEALRYIVITEDIKIPLDEIELIAQLKKASEEVEGFLENLPYTMEEIEKKFEMLDFDFKEYEKAVVEIEADKEVDEEKEEVGKLYVTIKQGNLDFLEEKFKRSLGKYALNGDKIVEILKRDFEEREGGESRWFKKS